eukprot:TRINITY_DN3702_c0_g1_i1.p1 TRINITY_DN3702_c0_g1~~TRINITY_DN3702_c0_g1_i1.p1  ORF type:complete len:447 (-),score=85.62 TRINITY_DN3702_c0_g1_i1:90-1430(-)
MRFLFVLSCVVLFFVFVAFSEELAKDKVIEIDVTKQEENSQQLGTAKRKKPYYEGLPEFFSKPQCTHSPTTPLLGVVMIVKNEARGMKETIASFRDYIDHWTILDTGSTDQTREIIREELKGVPGNLFEEPFVDFSSTKNRALELHGTSTVFTIFLHGDEVIVNPQGLVDFLKSRRDMEGGTENCYYISYENPSTSYFMERIGRTGCGWGFNGPTHEAYIDLFEINHATTKLPADIKIFHDTSGRTESSLRQRWLLDLDLLLRELQQNPDSERWTYYLGQTYHALEDYQKAYETFDKRVSMGGWQEEVFYSMYMRAISASDLGRPWNEVMDLFLQAHAHSPHRIEPLNVIARKYWGDGKHSLCYLFSSYAAKIPYPYNYILFIERDLYSWRMNDIVSSCAYYIGKFEEGKYATEQALLHVPEGRDKTRLKDNLSFYQQALVDAASQ